MKPVFRKLGKQKHIVDQENNANVREIDDNVAVQT